MGFAYGLAGAAAGGIGRATALRLARDGHQVIAAMRNPTAGTPLVDARGSVGLAIEIMTLEVDDPAGLTAIEDTTDDDLEKRFATDVIPPPIRLTRLVLASMRQQGTGAIVNVTSVAGRGALPPQGVCAASKYGREAASEIVAVFRAVFGLEI